jgi:hypothetical protein
MNGTGQGQKSAVAVNMPSTTTDPNGKNNGFPIRCSPIQGRKQCYELPVRTAWVLICLEQPCVAHVFIELTPTRAHLPACPRDGKHVAGAQFDNPTIFNRPLAQPVTIELAFVLVRPDHIASVIVNANDGIM